ncbi:unnamed protein product, partial [Owenia fusiformis]
GFSSLVCSVSLETLLAIAVERYIKIAHDLSYSKIITKFRLIAIIIIIWTSNAVLHCSIFIWNNYDLTTIFQICKPVNVAKTAYLIVAMSTIVVAMGIIAVLYVKMFLTARKQRNEIVAGNVSNDAACSTTRDTESMKTMALVNGLLYIFWAPLFTLVFAQWWFDDETVHSSWFRHVYASFELFLVGNSFVNPIVYAIRSKDFKDSFKRLLRL